MNRYSLAAILGAAAFAASATGATASHLITGKDVRNNSLTGQDIRNGSVGDADLSAGVRTKLLNVGATGATGATGERGATGATGIQGPSGARGAQGVPGPQGEAGKPGEAGLHGPQGPQGVQGPKGDNGTDGQDGVSGLVYRNETFNLEVSNSGVTQFRADCATDRDAVGGGYELRTSGLKVLAAYPDGDGFVISADVPASASGTSITVWASCIIAR